MGAYFSYQTIRGPDGKVRTCGGIRYELESAIQRRITEEFTLLCRWTRTTAKSQLLELFIPS